MQSTADNNIGTMTMALEGNFIVSPAVRSCQLCANYAQSQGVAGGSKSTSNGQA